MLRVLLLKTHRQDRSRLRHHIADSRDSCRVLHNRMEELISFLEDMLTVTPPQKLKSREMVMSCLSDTRQLLADIVSRESDYGMSQLPRTYYY